MIVRALTYIKIELTGNLAVNEQGRIVAMSSVPSSIEYHAVA